MYIPTARVPVSVAPSPGASGEVLLRAEGVELIGEFEGSGFQVPPLLARRADGQVVQLTKLLYEIAEAADGHRDLHTISAAVSERCGRMVTPGNVAVLAERKLRPLGVLALADGTTPTLTKRPPVMALRHRKPLLSEVAVNRGARALTWLHLPYVKAALLLALGVFDMWLFGVHGIAGALRSALYDPVLLLAVFASVLVATAFHEFGHASACRYGGARPGVMGVGLYLVWPVFYCDVTDAYRLNRAGRLRTDLGGVYFNAIAALMADAVFLVTGHQAALLAAFFQHVIILQQLIPLMRFDGYYVLTDLTGVPDILSRIKPIFRSLVRGRAREPRVAELKPWVRGAVTAYIVTLVPALLLLLVWAAMATPRLAATLYDSLAMQLERFGQAGFAEMTLGALRTTLLVLQLGAIGLSLSRAGRLVARVAGRGALRWSRGSVRRTALAAIGAAALLAAAGYVLWPNSDYRPIQPGERGTLQDGLRSLAHPPGGPTARLDHRHAALRGGHPSGPGTSSDATPTGGGGSPGTGTGRTTSRAGTSAAARPTRPTGGTATGRTPRSPGTTKHTPTTPTTGPSTTTSTSTTSTTVTPTPTGPGTTSPTTTSPTTTTPTTTSPSTTTPTTTSSGTTTTTTTPTTTTTTTPTTTGPTTTSPTDPTATTPTTP